MRRARIIARSSFVDPDNPNLHTWGQLGAYTSYWEEPHKVYPFDEGYVFRGDLAQASPADQGR